MQGLHSWASAVEAALPPRPGPRRHGQKMSKSKGNTVDPLGLIDKFGADALRFTIAAMESQGRDIKMDEKRVEGYRNFATKLWNAARFCQSNGIGASTALSRPRPTLAVNSWIIGETVEDRPGARPGDGRPALRRSANAIYHFVWATFCDWYLELIKPVTRPCGSGSEIEHEAARSPAGCSTRSWSCSTRSCRSSPRNCGTRRASGPTTLIVASGRCRTRGRSIREAEAEVEWLIQLVERIRAARTELNVPPGAKLPLLVRDASAEPRAGSSASAALARLARLESIQRAAFDGRARRRSWSTRRPSSCRSKA